MLHKAKKKNNVNQSLGKKDQEKNWLPSIKGCL